MKLESLISKLDIRCVCGDVEQVEISHISDNSRDATPGSLFIARAGVSKDGRAWIADAIAFRVAVILTDEAGIEIAKQAMSGAAHQLVLLSSESDLRANACEALGQNCGDPATNVQATTTIG